MTDRQKVLEHLPNARIVLELNSFRVMDGDMVVAYGSTAVRAWRNALKKLNK